MPAGQFHHDVRYRFLLGLTAGLFLSALGPCSRIFDDLTDDDASDMTFPNPVPSIDQTVEGCQLGSQGCSSSTVDVSVQTTRLNGETWDADGLPDLVLCWTHQDRTRCAPPWFGTIDHVENAECQDALACRFRLALDPAAAVTFFVIDVDSMDHNDLVGSGPCSIGRSCVLGRATVRIGGS